MDSLDKWYKLYTQTTTYVCVSRHRIFKTLEFIKIKAIVSTTLKVLGKVGQTKPRLSGTRHCNHKALGRYHCLSSSFRPSSSSNTYFPINYLMCTTLLIKTKSLCTTFYITLAYRYRFLDKNFFLETLVIPENQGFWASKSGFL